MFSSFVFGHKFSWSVHKLDDLKRNCGLFSDGFVLIDAGLRL